MESMARRILAVRPASFALAGLSMGGYVAMEIMRQAPERVETAGPPRHQRAARLAGSEAESPPPDRNLRKPRAGMTSSTDVWPKLVATQRQRDEPLKQSVARMLQETGAAGLHPPAKSHHGQKGFARPAAGLRDPHPDRRGGGDLITPPEMAREMAEMIEWASLIVIRGAGHLSALEEPDQVTTAMRLWLDRD